MKMKGKIFMKDIRVDVGVYTAFEIDLSQVDFTGIKKIILTVKNSTLVSSKVIIEREFTEPNIYPITITPEESVKLSEGAVYDFTKIISDGVTRFKITDTGKVKLRYGVGTFVWTAK
jgi:hypothetical protein